MPSKFKKKYSYKCTQFCKKKNIFRKKSKYIAQFHSTQNSQSIYPYFPCFHYTKKRRIPVQTTQQLRYPNRSTAYNYTNHFTSITLLFIYLSVRKIIFFFSEKCITSLLIYYTATVLFFLLFAPT